MWQNRRNSSALKKNPSLALFLALFLGPLGMFYVTITGAVIMLVINIVLGALTYGLALLVLWPLGAKIAYLSAKRYNLLTDQNEHRTFRLISRRAVPLLQSQESEKRDELESKLMRLKNFREKGLITERDFEEKKRDLLAGI